MIAGNKDKTKEIVDWMRLVFNAARAKEAPPYDFFTRRTGKSQGAG